MVAGFCAAQLFMQLQLLCWGIMLCFPSPLRGNSAATAIAVASIPRSVVSLHLALRHHQERLWPRVASTHCSTDPVDAQSPAAPPLLPAGSRGPRAPGGPLRERGLFPWCFPASPRTCPGTQDGQDSGPMYQLYWPSCSGRRRTLSAGLLITAVGTGGRRRCQRSLKTSQQRSNQNQPL